MSLFTKKRRGLIYVEAVGGGLLNKGEEYKGYYEVKILEETKDKYKIRFLDEMFQRSSLPKWVSKNLVEVLGDK